MDIIVNYCNNEDSRTIILCTIDLGRCFVRFSTVNQCSFTEKGKY